MLDQNNFIQDFQKEKGKDGFQFGHKTKPVSPKFSVRDPYQEEKASIAQTSGRNFFSKRENFSSIGLSDTSTLKPLFNNKYSSKMLSQFTSKPKPPKPNTARLIELSKETRAHKLPPKTTPFPKPSRSNIPLSRTKKKYQKWLSRQYSNKKKRPAKENKYFCQSETCEQL